MRSIIQETEDICVGPDTVIFSQNHQVWINPKNDFAHILDCGDEATAETLASNLNTLFATIGPRVLHVEKVLSLSC